MIETTPRAGFDRSLWVFLAGKSLSLIGDGIFLLVLPWIVYDLTGSALAMGANYAVFYLPRFLLPFSGSLIDRIHPRTWLITSNLGRSALLLALLGLSSLSLIEVWHLYVGAFLIAMLDQAEAVVIEAMAPALVGHQDYLRYNALFQNLDAIGWYVGPLLGGVLIGLVGPWSAVLVDALTYVIIATTCLGLKLAVEAPADEAARPSWRDALTGFSFLWRKPMLLLLALLLLFWTTTWTGVYSLMLFFFRDVLQLSALQVGFVGFVGGVTPLLLGLLGPRLLARTGPYPILVGGIASSGLSMALLPYTTGWLSAAAVVAFMDGPIVILTTIAVTARQLQTPAGMLGRVSAASRALSSATTPIMPLVAGAMADSIGAVTVMLGLGMLTVVGAVSLRFTRLRDLTLGLEPATDRPPAPPADEPSNKKSSVQPDDIYPLW